MLCGDAALFVDWDNLKLARADEDAERLKQLVQPYGRLVIARAYCDWASSPTGSVDQYALYAAGIEPVYVPCRRYDGAPIKNGVDLKLSADCFEVSRLYPNIRTFVIASCDVDFTHVVQALRRQGLTVVIVGRPQSTSKRLVAASDAALLYEPGPQPLPMPSDEKPAASCNYSLKTIDRTLRGILTEAKTAKKGYPHAVGGVKVLLKAKLPHFDEAAYDARKFGDFLRAREAAGVLRIVRKGTADYVALVD